MLQQLTDVTTLRPLLIGGLRILAIVGVALLVLLLVRRTTNQWMARAEDYDKGDPRQQRAATLGNLLQSAAHYVVWPITAIMVLSEVGLDVGALLAAAGVAGLAIGFGAQTLVKDVIGGIFLLFDNIIQVGDLVNVDGMIGTVESIGVRLVKVRKFDGELVMIPAGEIRTFGNKSVGWTRAIVPVGLSYDQDIDAILPVMKQVAENWAEENRNILLEDEPQVQSIMDFGDSAITARIVVQLQPGEQYAAERDLRYRLKQEFDQQGVEIPFPQRTVHVVDGVDLSRTPDPHVSTPPSSSSDRPS